MALLFSNDITVKGEEAAGTGSGSRVIVGWQGKAQRYCNSGYVLRRTAGDVSRGSQCDEKTEFQPTTQATCEEAARKMNRGFEVVNWGSGGPKCFVDARPNQNGDVTQKVKKIEKILFWQTILARIQ